MRAVLTALLVILAAAPAAGEGAERRSSDPPAPAPAFHAIRTTTQPIRVDGVLDEAAWETAWSTELPVEVTPGENTPAPVRTVVLLTYDREALYVGFRAFDPDPGAIRAHLTDRDNAWGDDWIGIVLDTFNDQRRDYLLLVNPLGVQMDNIEVTNGDSQEWDGIWHSAARITDWGWAAEFKVPFSSLSFQRADGTQVWGFDAIRGYPRTIFRQMGAFSRDRNNNCYLCQALRISGFEGVKPGRNLELAPTVTGLSTATHEGRPGGGLGKPDSEAEAGVSGRWGITPNLVFSGTVNPDFSQVEADALQLDINEPFALAYPEKRPFFMEASDFFSTPFTALYTRTMREPAWGAKLTGKVGRETVGVFSVRDDITNLIIPGSQGSAATTLNQASTAGVLRYKHDIGTQYTVGAMATLREGGEYSNRVAGVDGNLRFTRKDRVSFQFLGSTTTYPAAVAALYRQPEGAFSDAAATVSYVRSTRHVYATASYTSVGDGFRADLGFMPQVDYRRARGYARYQWLPGARTWFTNINVVGDVTHDETQRGEFLQRSAIVGANYQGPLQSHVGVQLTQKREAYRGQVFDQTTVMLHNCGQPTGATSYAVSVFTGDRIDYAHARPGRRLRIQGELLQRLGRHLQVTVAPTWERMRVADGQLYEALMADVRLTYQFTSRLFARGIVQFTDYSYDPARYADGHDRSFAGAFTQLLLSYKVNPRTVFFLGYTDTREGVDPDALVQRERTVFAKVGYAWTF
jgi:hypothetical protein